MVVVLLPFVASTPSRLQERPRQPCPDPALPACLPACPPALPCACRRLAPDYGMPGDVDGSGLPSCDSPAAAGGNRPPFVAPLGLAGLQWLEDLEVRGHCGPAGQSCLPRAWVQPGAFPRLTRRVGRL